MEIKKLPEIVEYNIKTSVPPKEQKNWTPLSPTDRYVSVNNSFIPIENYKRRTSVPRLYLPTVAAVPAPCITQDAADTTTERTFTEPQISFLRETLLQLQKYATAAITMLDENAAAAVVAEKKTCLDDFNDDDIEN
jgi:hypothetical protein